MKFVPVLPVAQRPSPNLASAAPTGSDRGRLVESDATWTNRTAKLSGTDMARHGAAHLEPSFGKAGAGPIADGAAAAPRTAAF